MFADVVDS